MRSFNGSNCWLLTIDIKNIIHVLFFHRHLATGTISKWPLVMSAAPKWSLVILCALGFLGECTIGFPQGISKLTRAFVVRVFTHHQCFFLWVVVVVVGSRLCGGVGQQHANEAHCCAATFLATQILLAEASTKVPRSSMWALEVIHRTLGIPRAYKGASLGAPQGCPKKSQIARKHNYTYTI